MSVTSTAMPGAGFEPKGRIQPSDSPYPSGVAIEVDEFASVNLLGLTDDEAVTYLDNLAGLANELAAGIRARQGHAHPTEVPA